MAKGMIRVGPGNRPFLDYVLYHSREAGYRDVVWVVFRMRAHPGRSDLTWNAGETWVNDSPPTTLGNGSVTTDMASVAFLMPDDANGAPTGPASSRSTNAPAKRAMPLRMN